jgi:hypothetical protein
MNSSQDAGVLKNKMNESRLDEDLKSLGGRPQPQLPTDFNAAVWSKIQSQETTFRGRRRNWLQTLFSPLATPQWAAVALVLALVIGWSLGRITTSPAGNASETRLAALVTGEVIDLACYFDDGASGPDHAACARMCIASGLPVGLKTKNGQVYVLIGVQMPPSNEPAAKHESLNAQLAPYAAQIVTVSGTIVSKEGVNVIENAQLVRKQARWQESSHRRSDLKAHPTHFL